MLFCFVLIYASSFMTIKEKVDALNKAQINKNYIEHLIRLKNVELFQCFKRANHFTGEIKRINNTIASLSSKIATLKAQLTPINSDNMSVIDITIKEASLKINEDSRMFFSGQIENINIMRARLARNLSELNQKKEDCDAEINIIKNALIRE